MLIILGVAIISVYMFLKISKVPPRIQCDLCGSERTKQHICRDFAHRYRKIKGEFHEHKRNRRVPKKHYQGLLYSGPVSNR